MNEDSHFVDPESELFLICDGMGGHSSGQLASQMAVAAIVERVADQGQTTDKDVLVNSLEVANQSVFQHAKNNPSCQGMGTTAIAVRVVGNSIHVCHVGDSRLYRLRGPSFQQLTRDHSLRNLYADKPSLEGRLGPATSNVIVRAIGLEPKVLVDHRLIALQEDDIFLLCCDGLSDLVDDSIIADLLQSDAPIDEIASDLVAAANNNGGTDNITVIIVAIISKDGGFHDVDKTCVGY